MPAVRAARHSRWRHVAGIGWVVLAGCAVLTPALVHAGLGGNASVYDPITFDQVDEIIPWSTLAWTQVHSGHVPLWNPYSVLGMPLAFNWQSAPFSLPSLIGYLFPLHLAFTVQLLVTLLVAGSGVYFLGWVMGLGVIGCTFGAVVFELSGAFIGWLGWPVSSVMSWAGWGFAAALLLMQGRHRRRATVLLAVVIAFAIYAGQPDTLVVLGVGLVLFLVVILVAKGARERAWRSVRRPFVDVVLAGVAGLGLGGPLLLPGVQLVKGANRNKYAMVALPVHDLAHVLFQGFDGVPVAGKQWFGGTLSYEYSSAYVGVVALVLAVCALWWQRHNIEVVAFAVVAVAMTGIAFLPPAVTFLDRLGGGVLWNRGIFLLTFALAVLAAIGMDGLVRHCTERGVLVQVGLAFIGAAVLLAILWALGRGHLNASETRVRADSFVWPAVETAAGLLVVLVAGLVRNRRARTMGKAVPSSSMGRWMGVVLLACETAFLVTAGAPLWSSGSLMTPTHTEVALKRTAGSALVGFGARSCFPIASLGILADINVEVGLRELSVYDPVTPRTYFSTWRALTGNAGGNGIHQSSFFCPTVTSTRVARRFGIGFIVLPAGAAAPAGSVYAAAVDDQRLYRVPGAAFATATPIRADGALPGPDAPGVPVSVSRQGPASMSVMMDISSPQVVRLRLTNVPGWHASIDGRALSLRPFSGVMLQARVPPGRHTIELHYWPTAFTLGIILAAASFVALVAWLVAMPLARLLKRKSRGSRMAGLEPPTPRRSGRAVVDST